MYSLIFILAGIAVLTSPAPAPAASITPAAVLPREDQQIFGWYSDAVTNGDTIYAPWEYDADQSTYSTSARWIRRCEVSSTCTMYTGCSNGFMVAEGTSSYCGAGGASNSAFCSNHIIYKSMSASDAYSWFWCDTAPLTGYTFYLEEPQQPTLEKLSTPVTSDATTTSLFSIGSSPGTPKPTGTVTMDSPQNDKDLNIGAIAGGVIGGVAILGAAGFAVFFLLLRKKHNKPDRDSTGYQQPYQQPGYGNFGQSAYQASNQKPPGVQEVGGYAQHTQHIQPYSSGLYDPHQSQCPANLTNTAYSAGSQSHYEAPASTLTEVAELPDQQQ